MTTSSLGPGATVTIDASERRASGTEHRGGIVFRSSGGGNTSDRIVLTFTGDLTVTWPNREGETFSNAELHRRTGGSPAANTGYILAWPSTASIRAVLVAGERGAALFTCPSLPEGRTTRFHLRSETPNRSVLTIDGPPEDWTWRRFSESKLARESLPEMLGNPSHGSALPPGTSTQLQVGLIGSDGTTGVPSAEGFAVLPKISRILAERRGRDQLLHIFGYAVGHDRGYPDYRPSARLGGGSALSRALREVRKSGILPILYLNARISEPDIADNDPMLNAARLPGSAGTFRTEYYEKRPFRVMDPRHPAWRDRVVQEAGRLIDLGAAGVQLDQIGGRIAATDPGEIWGDGYREMIEEIRRRHGLVWIQGCSDLYPADWHELTWRAPEVLEDGVIRGGAPCGEAELGFFLDALPDARFLLPRGRWKKLSPRYRSRAIIDLEDEQGSLFLYDRHYIDRVHRILDAEEKRS